MNKLLIVLVTLVLFVTACGLEDTTTTKGNTEQKTTVQAKLIKEETLELKVLKEESWSTSDTKEDLFLREDALIGSLKDSLRISEKDGVTFMAWKSKYNSLSIMKDGKWNVKSKTLDFSKIQPFKDKYIIVHSIELVGDYLYLTSQVDNETNPQTLTRYKINIDGSLSGGTQIEASSEYQTMMRVSTDQGERLMLFPTQYDGDTKGVKFKLYQSSIVKPQTYIDNDNMIKKAYSRKFYIDSFTPNFYFDQNSKILIYTPAADIQNWDDSRIISLKTGKKIKSGNISANYILHAGDDKLFAGSISYKQSGLKKITFSLRNHNLSKLSDSLEIPIHITKEYLSGYSIIITSDGNGNLHVWQYEANASDWTLYCVTIGINKS